MNPAAPKSTFFTELAVLKLFSVGPIRKSVKKTVAKTIAIAVLARL